MKFLKPGYKTSEFWIHGAVSAINWAASAIDTQNVPPKYALLIQVVNSGVYMLSRGFAKSSGSVVHVPNPQSGQRTSEGSTVEKVGLDNPAKAY